MEYNQERTGRILRSLRKRGNLSQSEMASRLSIVMRKTFTDENGKNTVSQLERGKRGVTLDYAFAYAEIFDVSLDYVLGRSDDWQPEHRDIKKTITGLSDEAISNLKKITTQRAFIPASTHARKISELNKLLESNSLNSLLKHLSAYRYARSVKPQDCDDNGLTGADMMKAMDVIEAAGEINVSYAEYAVICLHNAVDVFQEIARDPNAMTESEVLDNG
jgi:transcriptional regulator with XRE-family HTH domain